MATINGLTAERMQEIVDETIVSADVNEDGDLILEKFDGSTVNAGNVQAPNLADASTTTKGIIELATQTEVNGGVDPVRAVTPETLAGAQATLTRRGTQALASGLEARTGTDVEKAITPSTLAEGKGLYTGVIAADWSSGKANVTLDSGQGYAGVVQAFVTNAAGDGVEPGAKVLLTRTSAGLWMITGSYYTQQRFMKQIPIPMEPGSGWIMYGDLTGTDPSHVYGEGPSAFGGAYVLANSALAGTAYLMCTSTGIALLEGLIYRGSAPASNSIICRIPMSMVPSRNQMFCTMGGTNTFANIAVCTDGTVRYLSGNTGYMSISNIRWRTAASVAAGIATFTALTLDAGWASLNTLAWGGEPGSTVHTPGYTVDADKVVVFEGAVLATVAKAAAANICSVPALASMAGAHYTVAHVAGWGYIRLGGTSGGAGPGNILNTGVAVGLNQYICLSQIISLDATSTTTTRLAAVGGLNSWTTYGSGWAPPTMSKTPDGLCLGHGLWTGGTIPAPMTNIPPGWRPRQTLIIATCSNAAISRVDLGTTQWVAAASIVANLGSATWYSLDGMAWAAYR